MWNEFACNQMHLCDSFGVWSFVVMLVVGGVGSLIFSNK
jgi:hypothetical protein